MQDFIIREITVKAPKEHVYTAVSDPKQIISWFPDAVEGTFDVGAQATLDFGTDGTAVILIVDAKPFEYFAFRWYTGNDVSVDVLKVPNTLVEFTIEEAGEETKVTVKESGFAALPAETAAKSLEDNTGGWEYMMNRLETVLNQA